MFCPNCGANNSTEQNFCRSCGLNLEKIALSLLEQIPSAESANLLKKQKNIERLGKFGLKGLIFVALIGVGAMVYNILTKMIFSGTNIFGGIFILAFMFCAILSLTYVIYMRSLEETEKLFRISKKKISVDEKETAKLLEEKPFEPVGSIVENSTELLFSEPKTRKFESRTKD